MFPNGRWFEGRDRLRALLSPLAAAYRAGVKIRSDAYRHGLLTTRRLRRPVVSVGNVSVGGTGKTPLIAFIAQSLLWRGFKPSILIRGYRRRRGPEIIPIAPAAERRPDAREVGDEAAWLARALPQVPIVLGGNRYRAGSLAEADYDVDLHLLDDGFQHFALARNVDIVVLDATQEFSDRALLPAGRLREPCRAIERASFVILTRVDLAEPASLEREVVRINPSAKIFHARTRLSGLENLATGEAANPDGFRNDPACAFCGLGNPGAFFSDLRRWGFRIAREVRFRDHHVYSQKEFTRLVTQARESGARVLLTTEKDVMNFPSSWRCEVPMAACRIETPVCEKESFEYALIEGLHAVGVEC